jgi:hypothetical protein
MQPLREIQRAASKLPLAVLDPSDEPIVLGPMQLATRERAVRKLCVGECDCDGPTGIVEARDGDSLSMLPFTIGMGSEPAL